MNQDITFKQMEHARLVAQLAKELTAAAKIVAGAADAGTVRAATQQMKILKILLSELGYPSAK